MTIVVFGLDFRTAPVALREQLIISGAALPPALDDLRAQLGDEAEVAILATCNRVEVYAALEAASAGLVRIAQWLAARWGLPLAELMDHACAHLGDEAALHLMHVACGLDSMILGEAQILGQVTQAYTDAHAAGASGPVLARLFAHAIHAGKRARAETAISRHTTSAAHAGVQRLLAHLPPPVAARVLLVGAGETAQLAAHALHKQGVRALRILNRTTERAAELAQSVGAEVITWLQLADALAWADGVICATGAPHTVISCADIEAALAQRASRPLVLVDLAVPRDIDAAARDLPGVRCFDIDDLHAVIDTHVELRRAAVPAVEAIVRAEMARFDEWLQGRQVLPVIKDLRTWAQQVADEELAQTLRRLPDADARTQALVEQMAHQLVNRLLHAPTTRLRTQAVAGHANGYARAVRELFALEADAGRCCRELARDAGAGAHNGAQCDLACILAVNGTGE